MDRYRIIISAIVTAICYQSFGIGILVSLIPLYFISWNRKSLWLWGTIYMGGLHLFFFELSTFSNLPIAMLLWLLTSVYYGLFYGFGGLLLYELHQRLKISAALLLPVIWTLVEQLKSMGNYGNTNGNIGFALSDIVQHLKFYAIAGNYAMGVVIVMINLLIAILYIKKQRSAGIIIAILIIMTIFFASPTEVSENKLSVNVIQTSIPQKLKMKQEHWQQLEENYLMALSSATGNVIILPETIIPNLIQRTPFFSQLKNVAEANNQTLLLGGFTKSDGFYNSALLIQPNEATQIYNKQRLMPFGETLPLRTFLEKIVPAELLFNDFDRGKTNKLFQIKNATLSPLICLEGIYETFFHQSSANIVTILANNAWFNQSTAGSKLKKFAQVHAAQFQIPVLLAANYGQSAIFDFTGKPMAIENSHQANVLSAKIAINNGQSIYQQFPGLAGLILIIAWLIYVKVFFKAHR